MADIRLVKPQANTAQTVSCAADSRFVLEFPSDAALFARDGDDLVLTFEDGSSIRLQDFYTTYSKEEMPSFEMEGAEISGEDFFAALGNPDLMPAAGPTTAAAQGNSSFNVYGDAALLGGIDRLDGLDISFNFGQQTQDDLYASIGRDDDEGVVDHGVTVKPDEPGSGTPGIPVVPHPGGSDGTIVADRDVLEVSEANLKGGTAFGEKEPKAFGSMTVSAPDGVAFIIIDGTVVYKNGQLTEERVHTDEGHLEVTGYDPSTGKLDYTFYLTKATDKHKIEGGDKAIAHEMTVTVTDSDGDTGSGIIRVEITDDGPVVVADTNFVTEGSNDSATGNVVANDTPGADGLGHVEWKGLAGESSYTLDENNNVRLNNEIVGSLTLGDDGKYTFTLDANYDVPQEGLDDVVLNYRLYDTDGDYKDSTLTISIDGDTKTPVIPGSDPNNPESSAAQIVVDEALLPGGNVEHGDNHQPTGSGSFTINLNGEDGIITLSVKGGKDVVLTVADGQGSIPSDATLTVNGVAVTINEMSLGNDGQWNVSYTYELQGSQTHTDAEAIGRDDEFSGSIAIKVEDATGDTATGILSVAVHDDGPVLTHVSVEKEQIEDSDIAINGHFEGLSIGADSEGASITVEVNGAKFTGTRDEAGNWSFESERNDGSGFVLNDDGTFIFTRPTADTKDSQADKYIFNVTVKDGDGDTVEKSSTTVSSFGKPVINPDPDDALDLPEGVVSSLMTDDSYLPSGTVTTDAVDETKDTGSNTDSGSFVLTMNGLPYTVTLTGKEGESLEIHLNADGSLAQPETLEGVILEGKYGRLSGFTVEDGKISYTYTQTGNYTHDKDHDHDTTAPGADAFGISVSDGLHEEVSSSITVTIEDDGPVLNSITVDNEQIADYVSDIKGHLDGLNIGADAVGAKITVEVGDTTFHGVQDKAGKWIFTREGGKEGESFSLQADGKFAYSRPQNDVSDKNNDTYTIKVTITDGDGDSVSKNVTVSTFTRPEFASPNSEGVVDRLVTDDSGLGNGNKTDPDGENGSTHLASDSGSFSVVLNGQGYTLVISGQNGNEQTLRFDAEGRLEEALPPLVQGSHGFLTITSTHVENGMLTVEYTYTQTSAFHHPSGGMDQLAANADGFTVTVTDALQQSATGSITVDIEDDGPVVNVEAPVSSNQLAVDESYAGRVEGPGLEKEDSASSDTDTLDASQLFTVKEGADGEAKREYTLSISKAETGQKVLVDGTQYDLKLVQNEDGSISGVAGDPNGTVIFNVTIDSDTGKITLDMTGNGSLVHPSEGKTESEHDESLSIDGIQVTLRVEDTDGDSDDASANLTLTFEDDGPVINVSPAEDISNSLEPTLTEGQKIDFTDHSTGDIGPFYRPEEWSEQVTISAAVVKYEGEDDWGNLKLSISEEETEDVKLAYSGHNNSDVDSNKGLTVNGFAHVVEIGAEQGSNQGEAVVIDLNGKLAFGIEIGFGAFYSESAGEGTDDSISEIAQITFYKKDQVVYSIQIDGSDDGKYNFNITDYRAEGFDKVIISAVDNGQHSDFTIQNIDFVTTEASIALYKGEVIGTAGADGFAKVV